MGCFLEECAHGLDGRSVGFDDLVDTGKNGPACSRRFSECAGSIFHSVG